ncbi:MAG: phosphoribosylamine--glycine ligase [Sphingobacteriales bacterium]|nr:phosphoribosylamine--glycine ligase [Sphingobacteriales bacterium]MBI3720342.1 phosphoribosylamine--glycine ligase [Sphingobacteriales bacterium]
MNILLLGQGGREHALAYKLQQSPLCSKLFTAPGNAGTAQCSINVDMASDDFEAIKKFCIKEKIEMVVVGPEDPLVKGVYDYFKKDKALKDIMVIGPSQQGALLEGSKAFAKEFMMKYGIPTAAYREFTSENFTQGVGYIKQHEMPVVLKADGLAAGKGVVICQHPIEAIAEFELMVQQHKFGDAGKKVVIEEFLTGIELSVFVLTDGINYVILPEAKDYKRIGEGDTGLNTGGMGAVSPVPFADDAFMQKVKEKVIIPTIEGIKKENIEYKGFVFIGLIKVEDEPYVIEYNCRMGDPETEVVMPRLKNDLVELFIKTAQQKLDEVTVETDSRHAVTMMAVSDGYPGSYEKGMAILFPSSINEDSLIFHAGTKQEDDHVVTNGGRVLAVTSFGESVSDCVNKSKQVLEKIDYDGIYYRRDIGYEFM